MFCPGMICPITVEQLTKKGGTLEQKEADWQTVFLIASGIHIVGVIFYAVFASGEVEIILLLIFYSLLHKGFILFFFSYLSRDI